MAETAKPASGLHATAAPFVPGGPAKADGKGSNAAAAAAAPNGSAAAAADKPAAADKQTPAADKQTPAAKAAAQTSDKATNDKPAAANSRGAAAAGGNKAQRGNNKQQAAAVTSSKLAAAASAAPFVPGKSVAAASPQAASAAADKPKNAGKSKGSKQQQQQQQKEQQQQQQKEQKQGSKGGDAAAKDKEPKAAPAKMSASAAAFVPKAAQPAGAAASASADDSKAGSSTATTSSQQQQQQKSSSPGTQSAPAGPAAANSTTRNLRSPVKPSSSSAAAAAAGNGSSTTAAAAAAPSPSRPGGGSRGARGARGGGGAPGEAGGSSQQQGGSGSNARGGGGFAASGALGSSQGGGSGSGYGAATAAAGGGGGYGGRGGGGGGGGLHSSGGGGGGTAAAAAAAAAGGAGGSNKRGLLAQYQGNYSSVPYGMGGYGGGGGFGHQQHMFGAHDHHHHHGPAKQLLSQQFMPEGLRQQLQQSNYLIQLQYTPSADEPPLPDKIGHYHTLYPLEDLSAAADGGGVGSAWGVRTTCIKGISSRDGRPYALRVVCGKQVIPSLEMLGVVRSAVEAWSSLAGHPGLIVPHEGFVASELDGSPSLVVVHGYVPGAVTLAQAHLQPTQTLSGPLVRNTPTEEVLWSYTTQLSAVLRAAHSMGLALRPAALSATKVLVTPVGRLKVSGLGVAEALAGEVVPAAGEDLLQLQRDDVVAMGQLLLQLACSVGSLPSPSLDFASLHYSPEFVRLLVLLLGVAEGGGFSWRAVSALLGERLLLEMDALAMFNEQLLDALTREMENGRLFRLISKLAFVTDRSSDAAAAAVGSSSSSSDTGDGYLLQLFRDFVFHQGERDGGRVVDWGHIIENLNKLDAGVAEQVLLQSRDERSLLVVSYADIKRCIESAVSEIRTRAGAGSSGQQAAGGGVGSIMRPPVHAGGHQLYRSPHHHMGPR